MAAARNNAAQNARAVAEQNGNAVLRVKGFKFVYFAVVADKKIDFSVRQDAVNIGQNGPYFAGAFYCLFHI